MVFSVLVLESPLKGRLTGIPKWQPREMTGVYLGLTLFHEVLVDILLNIRTWHTPPHYHVVFDNNFSTVEHMENIIVSRNWEKIIEEHP